MIDILNEEIDKFLSSFLNAEDEKLSLIEKKFSSKIIHEIIKNKCEVVKSLQVNGVTNISVPVFDHTNQAIAAVTIPFLQRIKKDSLNDISLVSTTKILKDQALNLSKSLGFQS